MASDNASPAGLSMTAAASGARLLDQRAASKMLV
jgi:hypothetical protein